MYTEQRLFLRLYQQTMLYQIFNVIDSAKELLGEVERPEIDDKSSATQTRSKRLA